MGRSALGSLRNRSGGVPRPDIPVHSRFSDGSIEVKFATKEVAPGSINPWTITLSARCILFSHVTLAFRNEPDHDIGKVTSIRR